MSDPVPSNDPVTNDPVTNDPVTYDTVTYDTVTNDPVTNDPVTYDTVTNDPVTYDTVIYDTVTYDPNYDPNLSDPIMESLTPDQIVLQSQAALIICVGRLNEIDNIKDFLFEHGFTEESIVVLNENDQDKMPTYANITKYMQLLIGYSSNYSKIWIYYCGQGINDFDCLDKTIVFSDTSLTINLFDNLRQSCCETVCIFDMACLTPDIGFKWGVDIRDRVKIITFCESSPLDSVQRARTIPF